MRKGKTKKVDHEYVRKGSCNVWMFVEPLAGFRSVRVTSTKTSIDWARQVKSFVNASRYKNAEKIILVCDNLNTHNFGSLYLAFSPKEAFRLMQRIEFVYTPKHGSWLNMAEPELSVLTRQCFTDRVGSQKEVSRRASEWDKERNKLQKGLDWQFTTENARVKLHRLYPKIKL